MTSKNYIQNSTIVYIIIYSFILIFYFDIAGYHGDAAGNGMKYGFIFLLKLIAFITAVILTIINITKLRKVTGLWFKLLSFVPIVLALLFGLL